MSTAVDRPHRRQQLTPTGGPIGAPPFPAGQHAAQRPDEVEAIQLPIGAVKIGGPVLHPIGPIPVDHHPGGLQIVPLRQLRTESLPEVHPAADVEMDLFVFEAPSSLTLEFPALMR